MKSQYSIKSALFAGFVATTAMTAFTYTAPLMGIEFQLTGFKNPSSTKLTDGQKVQATAIGKFSVHCITREIEVPVTLTYYKESERTKAKMPGNLLVTNAEFKIKLSEYGIKIPSMVVGKLNDSDCQLYYHISQYNAIGKKQSFVLYL